MDIKKFLKPNKDLVIEIDEVEYLLDDQAIKSIEADDALIQLVQLYDRQVYPISLEKIERSLENPGPVDYLDKK